MRTGAAARPLIATLRRGGAPGRSRAAAGESAVGPGPARVRPPSPDVCCVCAGECWQGRSSRVKRSRGLALRRPRIASASTLVEEVVVGQLGMAVAEVAEMVVWRRG